MTAISAVRPEARELDEQVWARAAVRAVDDRVHVLESGDGRAALASGVVRADDLVELWELIGGQRAGRQHPDDVTVFKSVGTALQDLSLAAAIYRRARDQGRGVEVGDFPHARR